MKNDAASLRDWTIRLERFERSDTTLTQFCRDESVTMSAFNYWRKRIQALSGNQSGLTSRPSKPSRHSLGNRASHGKGASRRTGKALTGNQSIGNQVSLASAPRLDGLGSPEAADVQFSIESGTLNIQCRCRSLEAIEVLLSWAARHQSGGFRQLHV